MSYTLAARLCAEQALLWADRGLLRSLDESFVVLPGTASQAQKQQALQSGSQHGSSTGWSELFTQLTRAFEIASSQTPVSVAASPQR